MIRRALDRTASLWPDIERAYRFVHGLAHRLGNREAESAAMVRRRFNGLIGAMQRHRDKVGTLAGAMDHFQKVTRSYRPGLFHTDAVPTCCAPTTTSNICSAPSAITSGARRAARRLHPVLSCAARSG